MSTVRCKQLCPHVWILDACQLSSHCWLVPSGREGGGLDRRRAGCCTSTCRGLQAITLIITQPHTCILQSSLPLGSGPASARNVQCFPRAHSCSGTGRMQALLCARRGGGRGARPCRAWSTHGPHNGTTGRQGLARRPRRLAPHLAIDAVALVEAGADLHDQMPHASGLKQSPHALQHVGLGALHVHLPPARGRGGTMGRSVTCHVMSTAQPVACMRSHVKPRRPPHSPAQEGNSQQWLLFHAITWARPFAP